MHNSRLTDGSTSANETTAISNGSTPDTVNRRSQSISNKSSYESRSEVDDESPLSAVAKLFNEATGIGANLSSPNRPTPDSNNRETMNISNESSYESSLEMSEEENEQSPMCKGAKLFNEAKGRGAKLFNEAKGRGAMLLKEPKHDIARTNSIPRLIKEDRRYSCSRTEFRPIQADMIKRKLLRDFLNPGSLPLKIKAPISRDSSPTTSPYMGDSFAEMNRFLFASRHSRRSSCPTTSAQNKKDEIEGSNGGDDSGIGSSPENICDLVFNLEL